MQQQPSLGVFFTAALLTFSCTADAQESESVRARELREMTEIHVTADPFNPSLLEHSRPVTIVEKEELLRRAEPTLGATLGTLPGVAESSFAPGASRPIIRGNAGERVRVLRNGIGTLDASSLSEDHAVTVNPLAAETIEVLRGPETLLYGSSAIGGAVNVTDRSIPEQAAGEPLSGAADFRAGTADNELSGAVLLGGEAGRFNWHFNAFHQDADDIEIPGEAESDRLQQTEDDNHEERHNEASGTLPNSQTRSKGATIGGSYIWEKGFIGTAIQGLSSRYGIPAGHMHGEEEADAGDDLETEDSGVRIDLEQVRLDIRGQVREVSSFVESLRFKLGVSDYRHDELEGNEIATTIQTEALEGRVELAHSSVAGWKGVWGTQLQASDLRLSGEEAYLPNTDSLSSALFAFEERALDEHWRLRIGGRYELAAYDASGSEEKTFQPLGTSVGAVWDPTGRNNYTVAGTLAYTQRAPAASELFADGPHLARGIFEIGNSDIDNEESYGLDLTLRKNTGLVTGALSLFAQDYENYIELAAAGAEKDGLPLFIYEEIRALFWGFEAEGALHLHELFELWSHDLDLLAQLDMVRAKNTSDDSNLPRIPPLRGKVALHYEYRNRFGAGVEGVFVDAQTRTPEFELPTDSYQLLNASAHLRLPPLDSRQLTLYLNGTNLTNEEARLHTSFLRDVAPLRGRSLLVGIRASF